MARKALKAKEPIRLRAKALSNGNKSLYLDIYQDGARSYEFLKMYLIPETTPKAKSDNKETLELAEYIRRQRLNELKNGKAGLETSNKGKILLVDFLEAYKNELLNRSISWQTIVSACINTLTTFLKPSAMLKDLTPALCKEYIEYLRNDYKTSKGQALKAGTIKSYVSILGGALNIAVRRGYISKSPLSMLERADKPETPAPNRTYLTADEVRALIDTDCKHPNTKRAFLFACFCGLRASDVKRLRWCDIITDNGKSKIEIVQKKTSEPLYLPLSNEALRWLPEQGTANASDKIFSLPNMNRIEVHLAKWAESAGISKHVTFHVSRHTFATMALTFGADLYTTSKLLGHANITTTQIYAEIVDEKKRQAVDLFDGMFSDNK